MQDPYAVTFERRKLFIDQNATQMLQHILPNCLPSLYGSAFRVLRNAADAAHLGRGFGSILSLSIALGICQQSDSCRQPDTL